MNYCVDGGMLVDARLPLPSDPCLFHVGGVPVIGCTRLACTRCGEPVRDVIGVIFRDGMTFDYKTLYDRADLTTIDGAVLRKTGRQYLCRCSTYTATVYHPLEPYDRDDRCANVPWKCGGHPLIALPHDFGGVIVEDEAGLTALVHAIVRGELPPKPATTDRDPARYASRLAEWVGGTPLVAVVDEALRSAEAAGNEIAKQVVGWRRSG